MRKLIKELSMILGRYLTGYIEQTSDGRFHVYGGTSGFHLTFTNTVTGKTTTYTINLPFVEGYVNVVSSNGSTYDVTGWSMLVGTAVSAGTDLAAPPQTITNQPK